MKILNVMQDDFANFGYDNMKALRSVGLDCDSIKLQKHPFYEDQSEVTSLEGLKSLVKNYDVIQFFHDNLNLYVAILPYIYDKRIFAYHTSSYYRKNSAYVNEGMHECEKHIACMPEFVALCPGSIYMVGAVDTDKIRPRGLPITSKFGHYPSNPIVKGTDKIEEIFKNLHKPIGLSREKVGYKEQLDRISQCIFYIEMFTNKDGLGSVYGNFGITALEAGALGKIVFTNCVDIEVYKKHYGEPFFTILGNEKEFMDRISYSCRISYDDIKVYSQETRERVVRNHGYKATGNYFKKHVL